MKEHEIIKKILNGDSRAFSLLVELHQSKAMTLALRILENREDAEEALQDAFLRVFRALCSFEGKANFSTWFYRIVYNVCVSALEKRGTVSLQPLNSDDTEIHIISEISSPDEILQENEDTKLIYREIERLPVEYSSILTLFFVQQLRYDEITQVTGMPLGTVKTRLFRGRMMLREAVSKRLQEDIA
ncbi:MAG: sigma-70 family RNA polymerase sigma factor [Ignavibacteriae bacterium]|nr:sigma-70 family RNA polymerase sigma factor [Ignavibacteriota bacterium]